MSIEDDYKVLAVLTCESVRYTAYYIVKCLYIIIFSYKQVPSISKTNAILLIIT